MDNHEIEQRVRAWISKSHGRAQRVEVQLRNTSTGEVVHTTLSPEFVLGICKYTDVSQK